jgi:hypothetical protein
LTIGVLAEKEIEVARLGIENCAEIADAANKKTIARGAVVRVGRRFENDAEILPGRTVVGRTCGADARQHS